MSSLSSRRRSGSRGASSPNGEVSLPPTATISDLGTPETQTLPLSPAHRTPSLWPTGVDAGGFEALRNPSSVVSLPPDAPSTPVGGRLTVYYDEWATLNLSMWHHRLLTSGLHLSFIRPPPLSRTPRPVHLPVNPDKRSVLLAEVQALLSKKALERVSDPSPGFYSHLFTVPKKSTYPSL